jgi:hypothetical protein
MKYEQPKLIQLNGDIPISEGQCVIGSAAGADCVSNGSLAAGACDGNGMSPAAGCWATGVGY